MRKIGYYLYTAVVQLGAIAVNVWLILFLGNIYLSRTIDAEISSSSTTNFWLVNTGLLVLFGLQHSLMARHSFKDMINKVIPNGLERMTYLLVTVLTLAVVINFWQPMHILIWDLQIEWLRIVLYTIFFLGLFLTMTAQMQIDVNELMGIKQMKAALKIEKNVETDFKTPMLYQVVRHPLYLGLLILFWAAPTMTLSHLVFSIGMTIYIFIGIHFEEKDLVKQFGQSYLEYKEKTPMVFPLK